MYLFLASLDLCCCSGFLLVAESGGSVLRGLLSSCGASHCSGFSLESTGSVFVVHRPSCLVACRVSRTRDWNCPLHWQADSQLLDHQESLHQFWLFPFSKVFFPLHFMFHRDRFRMVGSRDLCHMKIRMKEKESTKQDQLDFRKRFNLINQLKKNLSIWHVIS